MLFGGLEIVAGGYLIHRHYRKKGRKEQLEEEAQQVASADNTKPGGWDTQAHRRPQQHHQPAIPQQKSACSAQSCPPQHQPPPPQALHRPRRHAPTHTQSFSIPRRPVPQHKPHIIVQPLLQRTDSFATISRMPIANGARPQDSEQPSPVPQHGVYANAGFSVSTPAFGATPTSPGLTYEMTTAHTVDDNWETYGHGAGGALHYAPTVSTQLGERDPPPPYAP
jgi:hypothetical protein